MHIPKRVKKALIIAAGRGMRMNEHSKEIPKCLVNIGNTTIIGAILQSLQKAGIEEVVIVTGYKEESIRNSLGNGGELGLRLTYAFNANWQKKNGVSVMTARDFFQKDEHFLLMMSDHLFEGAMLYALIDAPLDDGEVLLAVDRNYQGIFDIDDAMKVVLEKTLIRNIGKELKNYNGIDCGLFKCTPALFDALEKSAIDGDCSLSDGCRQLIAEQKFKGLAIKDTFWIDIDTPQALEFAKKKFGESSRRFGVGTQIDKGM